MSIISQLTTIAAAGAGGGSGFVAEIQVNVSGKDYRNYNVTTDSSDNIILCGRQAVSSYYGPAVIKLDPDATPIWGKYNYKGAAGFSHADTAMVDGSDNIYLMGYGKYAGGNTYDALSYLKYDSSGTRQFAIYNNGTNKANDRVYGAVLSGSIVFAVGTSYSSATNGSLWMSRYNTSGTRLSSVYAATTNVEAINDAAVDSAGNVYAVGTGRNSGNSRYLPYLAKWNSSGTLQWQKVLDDGAGNNFSGTRIIVDSSGNVYVGGSSTINTTNRGWVAKINSSGTTLSWIYEIVGGPVAPDGLAVDSTGNIYFSDYPYILKISPSTPSIEWASSYSRATSVGIGTGITFDSQDNLLLAGYVNAADTYPFVIKTTVDGVAAGTYGDWTFSDQSFTLNSLAGSVSLTSPYGYSYSNYSGTDTTNSLTEVTYTLSETITNL